MVAAGSVPVSPPSSGHDDDAASADRDQEVYEQFAARADFVELRRRYRRFVLPATLGFLVWYVLHVACNNWARGFMDTRVIGHLNVAIVFGLLQFVSTFAIAFCYGRYASARLDPLSTMLHDQFDAETHRSRSSHETSR